MEEILFAHLKDNVSLVEERVYPLIMPQNCTKPALVYTVVNDMDNQSLGSCVISNEVRFQLDIYGASYSQVKAVTEEVKTALYSLESYPMGLNSRDGFEEEQELYRQIIDFTLRSK